MILLTEPYRFINRFCNFFELCLGVLPWFRFLSETRNDEYPVTLKIWFHQKFRGINGSAYWPMHRSSYIIFSHKVLVGKHSYPGYQLGCFINGSNGIIVGDYTYFGTNVGLMSSNHNVYDLRDLTKSRPMEIGSYCWIGMNAVLLPNVKIGDFTIVGAGSVVTKSFPDGFCVIAGNPAKIVRHLDSHLCKRYQKETTRVGYLNMREYESLKASRIKSFETSYNS